MKTIFSILTMILFAHSSEESSTSPITVTSNCPGTTNIVIFGLSPENPFIIDNVIDTGACSKTSQGSPAATYTSKPIQDDFIYLSIAHNDNHLVSQPMTRHADFSIMGNGDFVCHFKPSNIDVPEWVLDRIQVIPYDWQSYVEMVKLNWLDAQEWAKQSNVSTEDIAAKYPAAMYPNPLQYRERTALEGLFPSCLHSILRDPDVRFSISSSENYYPPMSLNWHNIQNHWMKKYPEFKAYPTEKDIQTAEEELISLGYPVYIH